MPYLNLETYDEWLRTGIAIKDLASQRTLTARRQEINKNDLPIFARSDRVRWRGKTRVPPTLNETPARTTLGQLLLCVAVVYREMEFQPQRELLERYLFSEPPLHPRKTLAQYSHWTWQDTEDRDRRQVVFQENSRSPVMPKQLVMVDQLWLFI